MKSIQLKFNNNWWKFLRIVVYLLFFISLFSIGFYFYIIEKKLNPNIITNEIKNHILKVKNVKILTKKEYSKLTQKDLIIYKLYIQYYLNSNKNNIINLFNK